jgi:HEAT repeat protein
MHAVTRLLPALLALAACAGSAESRRAETLLESGDYAGARRAAEQGLERAPRDRLLWRIRMRALLGAGDARGAVALYASWRDLRGGDDPDALLALARTTLWQGLRARSPAIQSAAVQAVERAELEELVPDVAKLVGSEDELVAAAAAAALLTAHPQAPEVIVGLLGSDDPAVRVLAVDGIGRKAGEHARADLVPMLADRDPRVRRAAVVAVARFAGADERARLVALARTDPDGSVRAQALRGLAGSDLDGAVELGRQSAADRFLGARQAAVELLARVESPAAAAALDALADSTDLPVALAAAAARLRAGAAPDAGLFDRALADAAWPVRAAALNAAHAAPRALALALAGRGLADRRIEVRLTAARLLLHLGHPERSRAELAAALTHRDPYVRIDAAIDLCRMGDARGPAPLERLARSDDDEVRAAAVHAHASIGRSTAGLVAALADPAAELRLAAAEILLAVLD